MHKIWNRGVITAVILGTMVMAAPQTTYAETTAAVQEATAEETVAVNESADAAVTQEPVAGAVEETESEAALESADSTQQTITTEIVSITEDSAVPAGEAVLVQPEISAEDAMRQTVVEFGLQFLGNPYADRGSSPQTGFDCSGFIRYVFQHGIGMQLERSSTYQSRQGIQISENEMKPGDLIFYGNGSRINHVAMYIGNGQVVHASTYETGVKTSPWNYRSHVRIMRVIGVL